jgi:hypothetical protein
MVARRLPVDAVERYILDEDPAIYSAAAWAWGWMHEQGQTRTGSLSVLDRLSVLYLSDCHPATKMNLGIAIKSHSGMPRNRWRPILDRAQKERLMGMIETDMNRRELQMAAWMIAFHARDFVNDDELARYLSSIAARPRLEQFGQRSMFTQMLRQLRRPMAGSARAADAKPA